MTKKQEREAFFHRNMDNLKVSFEDREALRRIERTLHQWGERMCNGELERDERTGVVYVCYPSYATVSVNGVQIKHRYAVADREAGALRRLKVIMVRYPHLLAYHQTDPRGVALYLVLKVKLDGEDIDSCYSTRGVAVYK